MLARTAASRRAAATAAPRIATGGRTPFALTTPRATTLPGRGSVRPLSLWPFGKKTDPTLPVYFAQQPAARSSATAPRGSSSGGGGGGRRLLWRRLRYAIFSGLVYYALWQIYMSVVLDPLLDWAEAEWDSLSEKEKQEIEEAEDEDEEGEEPLLFLPFPFTTKQIAQPPYRGSDPEWKEFVRVNKDDKKQKEIKSECTAHALAGLVHDILTVGGRNARRVGQAARRGQPGHCQADGGQDDQGAQDVARHHLSARAAAKALHFGVGHVQVSRVFQSEH